MRTLAKLLFEDANKDVASSIDTETGAVTKPSKGGKHAFHGWGMDATAMAGFGPNVGPQFTKKGQQEVSAGEIKHAINYIKKYQPEELHVYSRGSAVWAKVQEADPETAALVPKVSYRAPAKLRTNWGASDIDLDDKPGEVYAAPQDGKIPMKQAAKIAADIGQSQMHVIDVDPRKPVSDADSFGAKGHANARREDRWNEDKIVNVSDVDTDKFPDWGDGSASEEELKQQMKAAKEIAGFTPTGLEERMLRRTIRSILLENQRR
jgi:hypothetical protein